MKFAVPGAVIASLFAVASPGVAAVLDFEDLVLATAYNVGTSFVTGGTTVTVEDFTFSGGGTPAFGFAQVSNGGLAGGAGNELTFDNVLVDFAVGNVTELSFHFGEYGGNLNIEVNGDFRNFEDFADIDGLNIGGASVSYVAAPVTSGEIGTISLTGPISSFAVGGQEFFIDDVSFTPVPLPATALLLLGGLAGLAGLRRRRAV